LLALGQLAAPRVLETEDAHDGVYDHEPDLLLADHLLGQSERLGEHVLVPDGRAPHVVEHERRVLAEALGDLLEPVRREVVLRVEVEHAAVAAALRKKAGKEVSARVVRRGHKRGVAGRAPALRP